MEVYLIRHTAPQIEKGICYGQSDIPLAETFLEESKKILLHLPKNFDAVYSSPLSRCMKLAQFIQPEKEIIQDTRLLEMNFGEWEMKNWNEIDKTALDKWMSDFVNVPASGGENFTELSKRVNNFVEELKSKPFQRAAVVTHAGVIRSVVAKILDAPLQNAFRISCDYASVSKIILNKDSCLSRVEYLNTV